MTPQRIAVLREAGLREIAVLGLLEWEEIGDLLAMADALSELVACARVREGGWERTTVAQWTQRNQEAWDKAKRLVGEMG